MPITVLLIDDSSIIRHAFSAALKEVKDIEVVGTAPDPYIARDKIVKLKPDVLLLDIEMPRMNGITFLRKLMKHFPIPVVIISSLTNKQGGDIVLKAMEAGAVEVLAKPNSQSLNGPLSQFLAEKIRAAAKVNVKKYKSNYTKQTNNISCLQTTHRCSKIVAIGSSTGGTQALQKILTALPTDSPPILITQHMPPHFTKSFADRLNELCNVEVREAKNHDEVTPGLVLIAPGGYHMLLKKNQQGKHIVIIKSGPLVCRQRPSVEVLFKSVAKVASDKAVGIILTGMGADGAKGLLDMRQNGAYTIAQDEKSCIVFGMPKEAINCDAACSVLSLDKIAAAILKYS